MVQLKPVKPFVLSMDVDFQPRCQNTCFELLAYAMNDSLFHNWCAMFVTRVVLVQITPFEPRLCWVSQESTHTPNASRKLPTEIPNAPRTLQRSKALRSRRCAHVTSSTLVRSCSFVRGFARIGSGEHHPSSFLLAGLNLSRHAFVCMLILELPICSSCELGDDDIAVAQECDVEVDMVCGLS